MPRSSPHRPIYKPAPKRGAITARGAVGAPQPPRLEIVGVLQHADLDHAYGLVMSSNAYTAFLSTTGTSNLVASVNVSDPENMVFLDSLDPGDGAGDLVDIVRAETHLYVSDPSNSRVWVIDATTHDSLAVEGSLLDASLGDISGLSRVGNTIFASSYSLDYLAVIDITTRDAPVYVTRLVDVVNLPAAIYYLQANTSYAYMPSADGDRLTLVDVSTPSSPVIEGTVTGLDGAHDVRVFGDHAYITLQSGGLAIVNVADDPSSPTISAILTDSRLLFARSLVLDGTYAYVTCDDSPGRVVVVDVSSPTAPFIQQVITDAALEAAQAIARVGDIFYVACDGAIVALQRSRSGSGSGGSPPPPDPGGGPPPDPDPPEADTTDYIDFDDNNAGDRFNTDLIGDGLDVTFFTLTASSKAGSVPTTGTNPFFGQAPGGSNSGSAVSNLVLSDYTLDMSDVPHNAHGIQVGWTNGLTVERVKVRGVRGSSSTPPGETFFLSLWHVNDADVTECILDGSNRAGARVGSTLLGLNDATDVDCWDCTFLNSWYGFAIACWQSGGECNFWDLDCRFNRRAINHERCDGEFTYTNIDMRNSINGPGKPHFTANSDQGTMVLHIVEPIWDRGTGPLRVGVNTGIAAYGGGTGLYLGAPNLQDINDIHVTIDGITYDGHQNTSLLKVGNYWS